MRAGVIAALLLTVVGLLGSGCDRASTKLTGSGGDEPVADAAPARPILVTQEWGVVDGMLSVVVRNTTDRTLRSAAGVITARDRNDVLIVSSLEAQDGVCCSVVDLPPGQEFGLYVDVGDAAEEISRVDVAYRDVAWASADESQPSTLEVRPVQLDGNGRGAVVVAKVHTDEPMVAQASVQAFLDGPDGTFLAVVAGRWYCFSQGTHEIRMQLLHPVPAGTTVDRVVIHPVADDPDGTALNCAGPAEAG
ncbi:hypothetical protein GCM10023350_41930 [Nocardioides endophyticus]|uniref:Lipoprotein n=2 Tax=Nocardioides endophyticus TaxID=1353775 RepID=A0ABP8ZBZ9_9ACTN